MIYKKKTGGNKMALRVLENFAGIGTQRMALENLGIDHEVVGITEIDKFAIKSYEAVHGEVNNLGDISKVDPNDVPDHDLFTYSFPCFTGDTLVLTDSGYKRIDEITIGDTVLTHTNQYKKVTNVFNQGVKDTVNVKGMAVHNIKTTENHKFLTRERYRKWNNDKRSYDRLFHEAQWVEAKDLTKDHYLGVSINQNSELPCWNGYSNSWGTGYGEREYKTDVISPLLENNNFWWLMGRYIADGWHRTQGGIVIAVPDNKLAEFEGKVSGILDYNIVKERSVNKIHFPIKELQLFTEQFGYYAYGKKISPEVLNLPVDLLESFIEGYFSGDGYYSEGDKLYKCTTTSEELVYGLGQCIAKVYHRPYSVYKTERPKTAVIEGRTVNQRDSYSLTFKKDKGPQDNAFYEDGHIWFPFNGLEPAGQETVYDIEVEGDHSFTVFNTIVHNCQDISVAGKGRGFEKGSGTRSGLLWECEKVIEAKKPKYLLMENVKNLVSKKFMPGFQEWLLTLEEMGYTNYWKVLNAKDFGIPQNRERVFCVSILGEHEPYEFPEPTELNLRLLDLLEDEVEEKYYLSEEIQRRFVYQPNFNTDIKRLGTTNPDATIGQRDIVYSSSGILGSLTATDYKQPKQIGDYSGVATEGKLLVKNATKKGYIEATAGDGIDLSFPDSKTRRGRVQKQTSQTLDTGDSKGVVVYDNSLNFYAKDDVLIDSDTLSKHYNNELPFDPEYIYVNPYLLQDGDSIVIVNEGMEQGEVIKREEKNWVSEKVIHDTDYLEQLVNGVTPKAEFGRMGRQAVETLNGNDVKYSDTINPFNKRVSSNDGISPTLTTRPEGFKTAILPVTQDLRIRKLTPKECWRLMGVSDEDFAKARLVNSDTQLYKQAGNAIVVNVLEALFASMLK